MKNDDSMLVISEKPLMRKCYHDFEEYTNWKDCTLRKWLNEDFYNSSFNDEEKNRILVTSLHNEPNFEQWVSPVCMKVSCKSEGCDDTNDRIFLLSLSGFRKYYGEKCDDADVWWWLRTPGRATYRAVTVSNEGQPYILGDYADSGIYIRPVMRIAVV